MITASCDNCEYRKGRKQCSTKQRQKYPINELARQVIETYGGGEFCDRYQVKNGLKDTVSYTLIASEKTPRMDWHNTLFEK